jgi:hypothetical protein
MHRERRGQRTRGVLDRTKRRFLTRNHGGEVAQLLVIRIGAAAFFISSG